MNTDTNSNFTGTPHTDPTNANDAWSIGGLRRVSQGRMIGGVAAGIGRAVNVNPLLIRIALVVATLWFEGLPILIYIALWMLIGTDNNPISPLQRWLSSVNTGYQAPTNPATTNMAQPNPAPQPNPWQYSGPAAPQAPYSPAAPYSAPAPQPPAPTAPAPATPQPAAPVAEPVPAAEPVVAEAAAPETTSTDTAASDTEERDTDA